jgi:hypothetical protein
MIKWNLLTGFVTGIAANIAGVLLYVGLGSNAGIDATITDALNNGYLGKIVALGSVLNFVPFFIFLRKKQNYHARGVLLATITVAIAIAIHKFI